MDLISQEDQATRRQALYRLLHSLSPSDLLFISQTIAPLLKRDFLSDLPSELALHVLSFVREPVTLCRAMGVSRRWSALLKDEGVWSGMCAFCGFRPPLKRRVDRSFEWRRYFKTEYIIRANWRHGGTLLTSHRLPILPPTNSSSSSSASSPAHATADSNGTVTSLAIDSDYVVVGLANSNIKVFSAKTGVLARTLTGHDGGVWGVCLISKGGWMMDRGRGSGPGKGKGRVGEGLSEEMTSALGFELEERTVEDLASGEGRGERPSFVSNSSIGWGQPNSIVVSGGCDKLLKVWDPKSGQCIYTLSGHTATIRCLRTMHNTPLAVTGSRDATLRVWDVQLGVCLRVLEGHAQSVRCLDVCGRRVVSGSYDTTCRIWDVDSGECLHVLRGHFHQIYSIAFDGIRVASGGLDTTVRVWDASTGVCIALLQGHTGLVCQLQFPPSSPPMLITAGSDGRVITFSLDSFLAVHRIAAHESSVTAMQADGEFLVTGGKDGRVRLWEVGTGRFVREVCESESVWKVGFGAGDEGSGGREVLGVMGRRNGRTAIDIWNLKD